MRKLLGKELVEAGALGLPAVLLLLLILVGVKARVELVDGSANLGTEGWWLPGLLVAAGIALLQTLGEAGQGTWPWLFTRPLRRGQVLLAKALAGLAWTLAAGWLPLLATEWLARQPGILTAPFDPARTLTWHRAAALLPLVWSGAFLGGLQGERPMWERLLTAAGTVVLAGLLVAADGSLGLTQALAAALTAALLVTAWSQRPELP